MKYRKPHRIKRKKSILKSRFFWLTILILIFLGSLFYFLFFSSFFQVKNIFISGAEKISSDEIKNFVQNKLEKKILFLRTKTIFLININEIEKEVLKNFPSVAEIKIGRKFPDVLNINLVGRSPLANFCQDEKCFLLDKEGIVFEESEPKANLIKIVDGQREKTPRLGEIIIERDYLEKIFKIQKYIQEEIKIEIEEFIAFSQRLNVKTIEGWEIYFDPREDINWQLTKLKFVLKEKIPLEKRKDLEYIELRFGDLATFRYR
jgi:cell division septal protein FtsQ